MEADQLDQIFKALADSTRRRIVDRLREQPGQSLFQICASSFAEDGKGISRQAVTRHLDMLERAGMLQVTWSGRTKIHSLDLTPLREAVNIWLRQHL